MSLPSEVFSYLFYKDFPISVKSGVSHTGINAPPLSPLAVRGQDSECGCGKTMVTGKQVHDMQKEKCWISKDFIGNLDTEVPFFSMDMFPWE